MDETYFTRMDTSESGVDLSYDLEQLVSSHTLASPGTSLASTGTSLTSTGRSLAPGNSSTSDILVLHLAEPIQDYVAVPVSSTPIR